MSIIEASGILGSAEGDDLAGSEGVEEEAGSEELGVDLLVLTAETYRSISLAMLYMGAVELAC